MTGGELNADVIYAILMDIKGELGQQAEATRVIRKSQENSESAIINGCMLAKTTATRVDAIERKVAKISAAVAVIMIVIKFGADYYFDKF